MMPVAPFLLSHANDRNGLQSALSVHDSDSVLGLAFEQLLSRCNGQDEAARLARKERESEVLIEALRGIVLRVDDESEDPKLGTCRAFERVDQERRTKSSASIGLRDGEAAEEGGGHEGITRELAGHFLRKRIERHAGRGERVEASHLLGRRVERDEARGDATPDVLRSLLAQVPIERARPAQETRTVVGRGKRLDAEGGQARASSRGSFHGAARAHAVAHPTVPAG